MYDEQETPNIVDELTPAKHALFNDIVVKGSLVSSGVGRFDDVLSPPEVATIHRNLIDKATKAYAAQDSQSTPGSTANSSRDAKPAE